MSEKTIPVCNCATPDDSGLLIPLCCGCGRLIVPSERWRRARVVVTAKPAERIDTSDPLAAAEALAALRGQGVIG